MARTEDAICYLTLVKGKFDNMGDFAEIVPQTINGADGPEERGSFGLRGRRRSHS